MDKYEYLETIKYGLGHAEEELDPEDYEWLLGEIGKMLLDIVGIDYTS